MSHTEKEYGFYFRWFEMSQAMSWFDLMWGNCLFDSTLQEYTSGWLSLHQFGEA